MLISEVALLLGITALVSLVLYQIKQPLVIAYILTGIILGPQLLGWLESHHELELFAQAGIVFLLFIVGLHLNPKILKEVGRAALLTGLGQVIFTSLFGFGLTYLMGFSVITSLFIAIALTFSSTIIIMKLISDRGDMGKLYAKLSIGFLLVQDLVATLILVAMPLFAPSGSDSNLVKLALTATASLVGAILLGIFLLPRIIHFASRSMELLFLVTVSWGLSVAALLAYAGLSLEVGALVAGILLSTSDYSDEIASRLRPLRDFFLVGFFLLLGSSLNISHLGDVLLPALILSLFVLVGNPFIVYLITQRMGYSRKVSFQSGLTVAQISEFSFILMTSAGLLYGLPENATVLVTVVGLVTIACSTYMITYADQLYALVNPLLKKISRTDNPESTESGATTLAKPIFWFGLEPLEEHLGVIFNRSPHELILIDYNPDKIETAKRLGFKHRFGDASDTEFLSELEWQDTHAIVSLIPDPAVNHLILQHALAANPSLRTIILARTAAEADELYQKGARYVVLPYHLSAHHIERFLRS
jgi:Kef-type K+ transport system membrane component KefB